MSDDHASQAIGAYGSRVNQTPHIDRLAREGMTFASMFVTNSICTPSRAAILTGQYAHVNGVPVFNRFDSTRQNVAKLLQAGGYYTAMIGKWHLGSDPSGFDRWEILPGQGAYFDPVLYTAAGEKTYPGYVTDIVTDLAIDAIDEAPDGSAVLPDAAPQGAPPAVGARRSRTRRSSRTAGSPSPPPFGIATTREADALRQNAQRVFDDLTRRDLKLVPPADLTGPASADVARRETDRGDDRRERRPDGAHGRRALRAGSTSATCRTTWRACSRWTTTSAGCSTTCASSGLDRNTVVIYTSDQGFYLGEHGLYDKRFMYEESLRMPFLVRWPAGIAAGHAHRRDGAQRGLRADASSTWPACRFRRHAGTQPRRR